MKLPIMLKALLVDRIWGGDSLKFKYSESKNQPIGEAWIMSFVENSESFFKSDTGDFENLSKLPEDIKSALSGILVKEIDAQDRLSVQVHPDDRMARSIENYPRGKNECWLILDAVEDAQIILGHRAGSRSDFENMINSNRWEELLVEIPVKKGDFFFIPAGTVHAIGAGIRILEIQQSSDLTYRLFDYGRRDLNGNLRELHVEKALEAIFTCNPTIGKTDNSRVLIDNEFFRVELIEIEGELVFSSNLIKLITVVEGELNLESGSIDNSVSLIYHPENGELKFTGRGKIVLSCQPQRT